MAVRLRKPAAKAKPASATKRDEFYRFEGDYHRRKGGFGGVDELLQNGKWTRAKGDTFAPYAYGIKVDPSEVR